uniref:Uncharacterized protein n=1 Tax=Peronospora matthiolae TaxID=2874970 RepID=A0AAV1VA16_9STRA
MFQPPTALRLRAPTHYLVLLLRECQMQTHPHWHVTDADDSFQSHCGAF